MDYSSTLDKEKTSGICISFYPMPNTWHMYSLEVVVGNWKEPDLYVENLDRMARRNLFRAVGKQ